jgi:hypothetical protein
MILLSLPSGAKLPGVAAFGVIAVVPNSPVTAVCMSVGDEGVTRRFMMLVPPSMLNPD